jgi:mRNA interferase MazF
MTHQTIFMKASFKAGEIILISFPFTDLSNKKVRPAFVLRNQEDQDLLIAPISTKVNTSRKDYKIESQDFLSQKLPIESYVRYRKVFTLNQKLVLKRLPGLTAQAMNNIQSKLVNFILEK